MEMNFTEAFFENENQVWCISRNDNYLYRLDIEKAIVEEIILLSPEEYQNGGYDDILCYDKFFILVPRSAESDIIIVNRENWTKQYIKIPQQNVRVGVDKVDFHKGIIYKDNLFLFGCAYPGIVKVNIQSKIVEVIDDWLVSAQKLFNNMQESSTPKM